MNINRLYENYGTYIVEQGVISKQIDSRLIQYLEEDDIRQKLTDLTNKLEDGKDLKGVFTNSNFKIINKTDTLAYEISKKDTSNHKITVYIKNIEQTSSKIDYSTGAYMLHSAISGPGTDELAVAAIGTALSKISFEDGQDSSEYFDILDKEYLSKYNESLIDAIEGDFSGNAEVVALSIFRRKIADSKLRGIDIENILIDIGLTISTFNPGTAVALKAGRIATNVGRSASKVVRPITSGIKGMISRLPGFSKLTPAVKASAISKNVKVGDTITHITRTGKNAGKPAQYTVKEVTKDGVVLTGGSVGKGSFSVPFDDFVKGSSPKLANSILNSVNGLTNNKALLTLTGKKLSEMGESDSNSANFFEVMGWYSTVSANPESFIAAVGGEEMSSLAQRMHDLSDGITTMGDELSMALIVTSLRPDMVKKLNDEYQKISTDGKTMLQDLEYETAYFGAFDSDVTELITTYVKGMLGSDASVTSMYSKLKK